ncbi:MAG: DUF6568 family protein [Bacilli bacterium]
MEVKNKDNIKEVKKLKKDEKLVTKKNYLIIGIVVLFVVLFGIYVYSWYNVKQEEKLSESYLIKNDSVSLKIKNLDEVNQILSEPPTEYFILISYTNNKDTYNLEKGLKPIIDKYALGDRFYYLNVTDIMKEDNYLVRINNAFKTDVIKRVPIILYYKDGVLASDGVVLRNDSNPINAGDFQKLLDIHEFIGR